VAGASLILQTVQVGTLSRPVSDYEDQVAGCS